MNDLQRNERKELFRLDYVTEVSRQMLYQNMVCAQAYFWTCINSTHGSFFPNL